MFHEKSTEAGPVRILSKPNCPYDALPELHPNTGIETKTFLRRFSEARSALEDLWVSTGRSLYT